MKRALIILLMVAVGTGLFIYPRLSNYLYERYQSKILVTYNEVVQDLDTEAIEAAWDEAVKYNENMEGDLIRDPFAEDGGMEMQDYYFEILHISDAMGYIRIPKIDVEVPIYHGTSEATLQEGIGHLVGSSMPVGGEGTHCVLTGHTGLTRAKLFTNLSELVKGDTFYLHILDQILAYEVDQIEIVEPSDTGLLLRMPGEDYCTLVTCTPYGVNSHRLMVRGRRIEYTPELEEQAAEEKESVGTTAEERALIFVTIVASSVMLVFIVIVAIWSRKRNANKEESDSTVSTASSQRQKYLREKAKRTGQKIEKRADPENVEQKSVPSKQSGRDDESVRAVKKEKSNPKVSGKESSRYWWDD